MYKTATKNEAKRLGATTYTITIHEAKRLRATTYPITMSTNWKN